MRRIALVVLAIGFLVPLLGSAPAHAQATRTWVSGVGDDANPCSRTAPCKTFAGAISKTAAGGEIDCLDPGGFGGITITKAITLNCSATLGSILVSGTPGVTINTTSAADKVVLRNIQIQGLAGGPNTAGTIGVNILSAAVVSIENCVITQFSGNAISDTRSVANSKLFVKNTTLSYNGISGIGIGATNNSNAVLDNVYSVNNQFGISAGNAGNNVMIRRSVFSGNTTGVDSQSGSAITVDDSVISGNTTGVNAVGTVRLSDNDISFNGTGISGATTSFGTNRISPTVGTAPTAAGAAQSPFGQQ
jgi:hypothetical protein